MAQGNAVRKASSSMDDILSSIRQIIAETEDRARVGSRPPGLTEPPANDPIPDMTPEPAPVEPELREASGSPAVHDSARASQPGSLADVLSRLDNEIGHREQEASSKSLATDHHDVLNAPAGRGDDDKYAARFSAEDSRAFAAVGDVLNERTRLITPDPEPLPFAAEPIDPPMTANAPQQPLSNAVALSARLADETAPLVSQAAQSSVSQSFERLSSVLEAQGVKALDDTVEDLLKPMLQHWLDNNLPTMVERMVRTEIERIARGEPRAD